MKTTENRNQPESSMQTHRPQLEIMDVVDQILFDHEQMKEFIAVLNRENADEGELQSAFVSLAPLLPRRNRSTHG